MRLSRLAQEGFDALTEIGRLSVDTEGERAIGS